MANVTLILNETLLAWPDNGTAALDNATHFLDEWTRSVEYYTTLTYYLNLVVIPVLVIIGILGNVLSLLVFLCTHLRYQSSSIYLAFLNVADSGFLLSVFFSVWLGYVDVHVTHTQGGCQLIIYLSYVFAFLSVWTVVSFTAERYIVVFYPLKKHTLCTPKRAKLIVLGLLISALVCYIMAPLTSVVLPGDDPNKMVCQPRPGFGAFWYYFLNVDSFVTFVIPSVTIIILNVRITLRICKFLNWKHLSCQTRSEYMNEQYITYNSCVKENGKVIVVANSWNRSKSRSSSSSTERKERMEMEKVDNNIATIATQNASSAVSYNFVRHSYQIRTTRTLVIVSSVFLVLNLPSHVFRLYYSFADVTSRIPPSMILWQNILQMFYYSNFSVNVFLYSACSRSFRGALQRLIRRWHRRARQVFIRSGCLKEELNGPRAPTTQ